MFEHPFSIEVTDAPEKFIELVELKYDPNLRVSSNQLASITFNASSPGYRFSESIMFARNLESAFPSTCKVLYQTKQVEVTFKSRLCAFAWCKIDILEMDSILILMRSKSRPKFHISRVSLSYFYCNVQFYVGYVTDI